jgi:hypothetical protein
VAASRPLDEGRLPISGRRITIRRPRRAARRRGRLDLGLAPVVAVIAAVGLLVLEAGNADARRQEGSGELLFWLGLVVIYAPLTLRLISKSASREERLVLVVVLALSLYLVKILHSPLGFRLGDELATWRTTSDLLHTGHLFSSNPFVETFSAFPGLATVAGALSDISGRNVFVSGTVTIGVARVAMMLALFLFLERVLGSSRGAGVGIAVYVCNPSFLYFDSQFAYESLALCLAAVLLLAVHRWSEETWTDPKRSWWLGAIVLLACALATTHHLTGLAVLAFLAVWTAMTALARRNKGADARASGRLARIVHRIMPRGPVRLDAPLLPMIAIAIPVGLWLALVAGEAAVEELGGVFTGAFEAILDLVLGRSGGKEVFGSSSGVVNTPIARVIAVASVGTLLVILPFAAWRSWQRHRNVPISLSLTLVALLYPVTLFPRLTQAGAEISQRASEYVFVGLGFVIGFVFAGFVSSQSRGRAILSTVGLAVLLTLVLAGGIIVGESPATRQPGPFRVGTDSRSISPEGIAAARFASRALPRDSRVLADRPNAVLLGSYGGLDPVVGSIAGIDVTRVFFTPTFDDQDRTVVRDNEIDYVVRDLRLTRDLPVDGYYFYRGEPDAFSRDRPIGRAPLRKFDYLRDLSKIYTNGYVAIYDTSGLRR